MANLIDRFKHQVTGSSGKIFDYLPTIDPSGDFKRISDIDVLVNSYSIILSTSNHTYDHDPEFGCDLHRFIFEPADMITRMEIDNVIRNQLMMLEPRAKLKSFDIATYSNGKGFLLTVVLSYNGQDKELNVPITQRD